MIIQACFIQNGCYFLETLPVALDHWSSLSAVLSLAKALIVRFAGKSPKGYPQQDPQMFQMLKEVQYPHPGLSRHPSFSYWQQYICDQIQSNRAFRTKNNFYIEIEFPWKGESVPRTSLYEFLSKEKKQQIKTENRSAILMLFKKDWKTNRYPFIPLRALYMGIYFNNQQWKTCQLAKGEHPSDKQLLQADLIYLPGSSCSVLDEDQNLNIAYRNLKFCYQNNKKVRIMGNCFGHQMLALAFGGKVKKIGKFIYGQHKISITKSQLFKSIMQKDSQIPFSIFHGDQVDFMPEEQFISLAKCPFTGSSYQIFVSKDFRIFSTQGHPQYTSAFSWDISLGRTLSKQLVEEGNKLPSDPEVDLQARRLALCFVGLLF